MERQLALIETEREWKIDDHTKEVGREGLARAREALRQARRTTDDRATAA